MRYGAEESVYPLGRTPKKDTSVEDDPVNRTVIGTISIMGIDVKYYCNVIGIIIVLLC